MFPDQLAFAIRDLDRDRSACIFRKEIIDHRAVWRIFASRFVGRQWRVSVKVRANAQRGLRSKQPCAPAGCSCFAVRSDDTARRAGATLPERRDVVEDPEPATMRTHNKIV